MPSIVDDGGWGGAGDGRTTFARVEVDLAPDGRYHVRSAGGQGSHQLYAMALANALAPPWRTRPGADVAGCGGRAMPQ